MTKLEILRRQAPVGAHVTLRLTRGEDVSGRVDELEDAYICLYRDGATVTVFEELVAGWEVHRHDTSGDAQASVDVPMRHEEIDNSATPHATPVSSSLAADSDILQRFAQVKAEFSAAVKRTRVKPPSPDFQFPETEFPQRLVPSVRRDWDRARNQYDYALKVREIGRLNSVVSQILDPLEKRFPRSATIKSLLGRVLLKLDRHSEAIDHLSAAAILSDQPAHWLTLASAAGENTAIECYALRRYFRLTPPEADDAWFRYLAVAIEHRDLRRAAKVVRHWCERQDQEVDANRLLLESAIYMLSLSDGETSAMQATAAIVHGSSELPSEWHKEFDGVSSSEKLLAVEARFDRPTAAAPTDIDEPDSGAPRGRIASFINQRFGFIDAPGGDTYYFRIENVSDERLHDALLDGSWKTFGAVEFRVLPSHGHKYNRAANILPLQNSVSLLQRAQNLLKHGQPPQAMELVRRVLGADPADETALRLEREIKDDLKKQLREGIGLPKGNGPYARAKRALLVDLNLEQGENLLKQAIRRRDKPESAIKDLASLLQRQGRIKDAIALLEDNSTRFNGDRSYDNMLASLYERADRYSDAIEVLERLERTTRGPGRDPLLKRIALSQIRCARYDEAERVLRKLRNPERLLAVLEDSRREGTYDEAEEIIGGLGVLAEEGIKLSSLAHAAIDNCTYEGIDPARIQAGTAGSRDVARVEELAKKLGTRRPRDRAAYYLSAAALLKRDPGESGSGRIYDYLRRYFASMADASWIDKKPADTVRSYYMESLALVFDYRLDEAWRSLLRFLSTFSTGTPDDVEAILPRSRKDALQEALQILADKTDDGWLDDLITAGSQSSFARDRLGEAFSMNPDLRSKFGRLLNRPDQDTDDVKTVWRSRCRERARRRRQRLSVCQTLIKYRATVASMEDLGEQIRKTAEETSTEMDRRRLNTLSDIVDSALAFCRASDFEERERNFWLVTTQAERFKEEVVDAPTQYSHEGLLPIADHLKSLIEEEYAQMDRTSGAELKLRLLVDKYLRGQQGELRLQIEVSNKQGCSPASSVRISLGPADSEYFSADSWEREIISTLRGGHTEITQMVVHPKDAALHDRAFPINAIATYRNRLGEDKRTDDYTWTVRLYDDKEFKYLKNPYAPFAEGGPVDDPKMFVGRDELLARLESSLVSGSGSKSIVMFGQKRAGKSSLIEHLRRRLVRAGHVVPVCFSLQDIAPELSVPALLHRILYGISEALDELRSDDENTPDFSSPGIETMESHPTLRFHECMASAVRSMRRHPSNFRVVLLVDEFTDIFKGVRKGRIPREFMKAWKAIIEKKYFASVLVGQDVMPAFKDEFPNEFGVTEDIRITYLDDVAATTLVQKPIGEERFAGRAVRLLLELTANSPYYTMMFCARLVDYMNTTRSVIVTEADIRAVEDEMLRGDRRLTRDKFDNLLSAGDGALDSGVDPAETHAVCAAIARESQKEGWCDRESVRESLRRDIDAAALDVLLSDLETRDVVERKGMAYRLRVGLFQDWLALRG